MIFGSADEIDCHSPLQTDDIPVDVAQGDPPAHSNFENPEIIEAMDTSLNSLPHSSFLTASLPEEEPLDVVADSSSRSRQKKTHRIKKQRTDVKR